MSEKHRILTVDHCNDIVLKDKDLVFDHIKKETEGCNPSVQWLLAGRVSNYLASICYRPMFDWQRMNESKHGSPTETANEK